MAAANLEQVDELEVDAVLVATGRAPYTNGLNLGAINAETDRRGFVPVNDKMQVRLDRLAVGLQRGSRQYDARNVGKR